MLRQQLDLSMFKDSPHERFLNVENFDNIAPLTDGFGPGHRPGNPGRGFAEIFQMYFSTKNEGQGTGLGLNIVQRLVKEARRASCEHGAGGEPLLRSISRRSHPHPQPLSTTALAADLPFRPARFDGSVTGITLVWSCRYMRLAILREVGNTRDDRSANRKAAPLKRRDVEHKLVTIREQRPRPGISLLRSLISLNGTLNRTESPGRIPVPSR